MINAQLVRTNMTDPSVAINVHYLFNETCTLPIVRCETSVQRPVVHECFLENRSAMEKLHLNYVRQPKGAGKSEAV